MAGVDSNLPLQLAFVDLSLQPAHPLSFGVEHRDLVLHLDQRQAGHALSQQLLEHCLELADDRIEHLARSRRCAAACSAVRWCMNIKPAAKCGYSLRGWRRSSPSVVVRTSRPLSVSL